MRKIALIGTGASGKDGPYDDKTYEIWGVASRFPYVTRADRWFELHRIDGETQAFQDNWRKALHNSGLGRVVELLMFYPEPDLGPKVKAYPHERITTRFGTYFMTSSFSWMMALAIDELRPEGGKPVEGELGIWGVDMEYGTEYCVAPEMRVLTSDLRWVPAGDIKEGDTLLAFDETSTKGKTRGWRQTEVESAARLTRPCFRLFMDDGTELVSSAEHRWLTWAEHEFRWKRTDEMVTASHRRPTKICKPINTWDALFSDWDAGYVAAALDGEGHLSQGSSGHRRGDLRLGFSQRENAMSEEFLNAVNRLGYEFSGCKDKAGCIKYTIKGTRNSVLEFLGRLRPPRLMAKFDATKLGAIQNLNNAKSVERAEFLGDQEVVALKTGTGTFIAEGFASHNSQQRAGFRHFVDIARVLGIKVSRFADSGLSFEPVPYPLWQDDPLINKLEKRKKDTSDKLRDREETLQQTRMMIAQNQMAIQELSKGLLKKDRNARISALEKELDELLKTSAQLSHDIVANAAIQSEQDWFRDYLSH